MIEAELKARLTDPESVRAALGRRAVAEPATYRDTYFDTTTAELDRTGRELRLRTIESPEASRHVLTYKEPAVDQASGSKPEYETEVTVPSAAAHLIQALGYRPALQFTKDCENYRFSDSGRDFVATMVRVPEIEGTFLEVETMAEQDQVDEALTAVRAVLTELGVAPEQLTTKLYTDAVRAARMP